MFRNILTGSRYAILIAVIGSLAASLLMLLYGGLELYFTIARAISQISLNGKVDKSVVTAIDFVDVFLLGTAFYLIALGLYELFIDESIELPKWLVIKNFDDLKGKLISVLVVVLGVVFLSKAIEWDGTADLLSFGAAIALIIASLSYFLNQKVKKSGAYPPGEE